MENKNQGQEKPGQQNANSPAGQKIGNPFENGKTSDQDVRLAKEELEKEQEFKDAQTERD